MIRLTSPFVLDLRSIALFRVALGCILFSDLLVRIKFAELFLSDSGALSRADLLSITDRPWSFSLYMMFGETSQVVVLLLLHAGLALLLIVGLWTRVASVLCWVLLLSLQHRNPLVLNGGDTLLSVLYFWAMFLPLNARWSLDALIAGKKDRDWTKSNRYHGLPGAALVLQVVMLYAFTVILKSGELWRDGEAVGYVVMNQSLVKSPAVWLSQFEAIHPFLTYLTWHWEWFGCVLLLCPFANNLTRLAAVLGYSLMQLSFFLTLDVALFPFVSIAAILIFLPAPFWRGMSRLFRGIPWSRHGQWMRKEASRLRVPGGKIVRPSRAAAILSGVALFLVFFWNVRGLPDSPLKPHTPKWLQNVMYGFKIRQSWGMFAANPPRNSTWYALEAQLANGDSIDLFHPSQPFTRRRPELFTDRLPDRRWTKFLSSLKKKKYRRLRDDFLEYFVGRWNQRVASFQKVERARLLYFRERIYPGSDYGSAKVQLVETYWAEGVKQFASLDVALGAADSIEAIVEEEIETEGADL